MAQAAPGQWYYDNDGDLRQMPSSRARSYYDNSGDLRISDPKNRDVYYNPAMHKPTGPTQAELNQKQADALLKQWYADEASRKAQTQGLVSDITTKSKAAGKSAVDAFKERSKAAADAAKQTMKKPVSGVATIDLAALKPLQKITGVALNSALTGGNAATQQFYINPESTQAQFAVGAPVGGGGIGTRQRASTTQMEPTKDTLGSKRKDQL